MPRAHQTWTCTRSYTHVHPSTQGKFVHKSVCSIHRTPMCIHKAKVSMNVCTPCSHGPSTCTHILTRGMCGRCKDMCTARGPQTYVHVFCVTPMHQTAPLRNPSCAAGPRSPASPGGWQCPCSAPLPSPSTSSTQQTPAGQKMALWK